METYRFRDPGEANAFMDAMRARGMDFVPDAGDGKAKAWTMFTSDMVMVGQVLLAKQAKP